MTVHPAAAAGFGAGADAYERGRPSYPAAAVELLAAELGIGPGTVVVDLGAGTGKWSRLLVARGARVVAVEPVPAMREALAAAVPGIEVLDAPAEAVPLPSGSADVVTAAQAFHWFDPGPALAEVARLVRPGGGVGLVWNERDGTVAWVAQLNRVMRGPRSGVPAYEEHVDWAGLVAADGHFTALRHRVVPNEQELDEPTLMDRVASVSYVAALPDDRRAAVLGEVRELVRGFPSRFTLPYRTDVFWCHRTSTP